MKRVVLMIIPALIGGMVFTSCDPNEETADKSEKVADISELGLLWNHGSSCYEQERGYYFSFSGIERIKTLYELLFEYKIDNHKRSIEITLIDKIDKSNCYCVGGLGHCIDWDGLCVPYGSLFIPEKLLIDKTYTLIVRTLKYTIQSEFIITKEKAILNIPENNYFSSEIKEVFIAPKNLLYGRIWVSGEQNKKIADNFIDDLRDLGQRDTIWTNPHIFLMDVDEAGNPITYYSPPDSHSIGSPEGYSIGFLMTQTSDFSTILELAENYITKFSLGSAPYINIASTNGDQATLSSKHKHVCYAK